LLVESEGFLKNNLQEALNFYGYEVATAKSAENGIENLKNETYDAVISDHDLIDMRGEYFLLWAKNQRRIPVVILMVSTGEVEKYKKYNSEGIDVVIEKPFPYRAMLGLIERLIKKTRQPKTVEVI
jgi:DNA-binding NtrC family response regulator